MTMMTIINLYYNDKENRPCLYLPDHAYPDSISCAAHGSTTKGDGSFIVQWGKGESKSKLVTFPSHASNMAKK